MDVESIVQFMQKLRLTNIKPDGRGAWMRATCPFALYRHGKGTDNSPSFGISIHPGGESRYNCFGCNEVGPITKLLGRLERLDIERGGGKPKFAYDELDAWVRIRNPVELDKQKKKLENANYGWSDASKKFVAGVGLSEAAAKKLVEPDPLDESILEDFEKPPPFLREYLHNRHLNDQSIKDWEIRWHEKAKRIAIPIRDCLNRLVGVSGRAWEKGQKPKFLHSAHFGRDFYLYGEKTLRHGEAGYLCEGFFDVIVLQQMGINAFAIMGTHISRLQIEKCVKWLTEVVIILDGDAAGSKFSGGVKDAFDARKFPARVVKLPEGLDPDEVPEAQLRELIR